MVGRSMDIEQIRSYFNDPKTVDHYVRAVANVGLWESERLLMEKWFRQDGLILDLGCGAGRVGLGLWKMGFRRLWGADLSEEMVREARGISECLGAEIAYQREDATKMSFETDFFKSVIFGFNGLMQIPLRENRRKALKEILRITNPGGVFIFTTLDRENRLYEAVFRDSSDFNHDPVKNPNVLEEGDRHFKTKHGMTFMHVPRRNEVLADLETTGWIWEEDHMRSEVASESADVLEFSEDCRFWIAKKPTS
ncbi:MAG: class I SAM-dependent methyltransferase [Opitutaceae bacterium]|nr:class I SAM-dependent methyltransferase [Opitutaceae bacterium]